MPVVISAAVEGPTDEAVARKLIEHVGAHPGAVYGLQGKAHLREKIGGYNQAADHAPWLVVVDLDREADCAPALRQAWLPQPAPGMCFRVAVRAIEAWLLADAEALAEFLGVTEKKVPKDPEALPDPKQTMVNLARRSRRRDVRADMVPCEASRRRVGPAYTSRLTEFASDCWRPAVAAQSAKSLERALRALKNLVQSFDP